MPAAPISTEAPSPGQPFFFCSPPLHLFFFVGFHFGFGTLRVCVCVCVRVSVWVCVRDFFSSLRCVQSSGGPQRPLSHTLRLWL